MRRRRNYKFTEKSHSKKGILSFLLSLGLVGSYLVFIYLSFHQAGALSVYYGSAGVLLMLVSVIVFFVSIYSLVEEDSFKKFPRLAVLTSGIAVVVWLGTYIIGFMRG